MNPLWSSLRRRVGRGGTDQGASLVLALIFITTVAVVIAAVLTLAFANLRASAALTEQAAEAAAADGAAQIAINELRLGTFNGLTGGCFGGSSTLAVPPARDGGGVSAFVECTRDEATSDLPSPVTGWPYALVALPAPGETGISIDVGGNQGNTPLVFAGDVRSSGPVQVAGGILDVTNGGQFSAVGCVLNNPGKIRVNGTLYTTPGEMPGGLCSSGANPPLPSLNPPAPGPTDNGSWTYTSTSGATTSNCVNGNNANSTAKITFQPGRYASTNFLNAFDCGRSDIVYDFRPGVYYFNAANPGPSGNVWSLTKGTLVAGSAAPVSYPAPAQSPPITCEKNDPAAGVVFVFANQTQWLITGDARVQVCGRPPTVPGSPSIAIYSLGTSTGPVLAQNGCVVLTGPGACPMLRIEGTPDFSVHGVTYLPGNWIDVDINGSGGISKSSFIGGILARRLSLEAVPSVTLPSSITSAPLGPGPARTVLRLTVHVCPEAATCGTGGRVALTATVGIADPTGTPTAGGRPVTVYSWNVHR